MVIEQFISPPCSVFEARRHLSDLGHSATPPDKLVDIALRTISASLDIRDKAAGFTLLCAVASTGSRMAAKALAEAIDQFLAVTDLPDGEVRFYEGVAENWREIGKTVDFSAMARGSRPRLDDDRDHEGETEAGTAEEPSPTSLRPQQGKIVLQQVGDAKSTDGKLLEARFAPLVGRRLQRLSFSPAPGAVHEALTTDWPWAEEAARAVEQALETIRLTHSKRSLSQPILFVGPPGCGKTSIASAIASLLGRHSVLLPAAGTHDAGSLAAVARGWAGSRPSLPVMAMLESMSCDPCVIVDELDKASDIGSQNGSVVGTLLGMLNGGGYFDTALLTKADLSDVLFLATANDIAQVSAALLDRFQIVHVGSPEAKHLPTILRKLKRDKAAALEIDPFQLPDLDDVEHEVISGFFDRSGHSLRAVSRAYDTVLNAALRREQLQPRM